MKKTNKDSNQQRVQVARKDKNLGKIFAVLQKSAATTKQDSTEGKEEDERITTGYSPRESCTQSMR